MKHWMFRHDVLLCRRFLANAVKMLECANEDIAIRKCRGRSRSFMQRILAQYLTGPRILLQDNDVTFHILDINSPVDQTHGTPRCAMSNTLFPSLFARCRIEAPANTVLIENVYMIICCNTRSNSLRVTFLMNPEAVTGGYISSSTHPTSDCCAMITSHCYDLVSRDDGGCVNEVGESGTGPNVITVCGVNRA